MQPSPCSLDPVPKLPRRERTAPSREPTRESGDQNGRRNPGPQIGNVIRRLRQQRGLSLQTGRRTRPTLRLLPGRRRARRVRHLGRTTLPHRRRARSRPRITPRLLPAPIQSTLHSPRGTRPHASGERRRSHGYTDPRARTSNSSSQPSPPTARTSPSHTQDSTSSSCSRETSSYAWTTPTTP